MSLDSNGGQRFFAGLLVEAFIPCLHGRNKKTSVLN